MGALCSCSFQFDEIDFVKRYIANTANVGPPNSPITIPHPGEIYSHPRAPKVTENTIVNKIVKALNVVLFLNQNTIAITSFLL